MATSSVAVAAPPERAVSEVYSADETVFDTFPSEACGSPVTARLPGHYRVTLFFYRDGSRGVPAASNRPRNGMLTA